MKSDHHEQLADGMRHLRSDPVLAKLIKQFGAPDLRPHKNYYASLVSSVVSQQLSVKAAQVIENRFLELFKGTFPTPEQIMLVSDDELRAIGFSYAKARYVHDLARHVIDGRVHFDTIDQQSNDEIIAMLTPVKGIGEWTVHMFLIFCVGRLNVLPVGDLGIKNGIQKLYTLPELPSPADVQRVADTHDWAPYESVASWYVWRSLDNKPNGN